MRRRLSLLAALAAVVVPAVVVSAQPEGWRMTDRFHGSRYEICGRGGDGGGEADAGENPLLVHVQAVADRLACFGWVQRTATETADWCIVGEARCSKAVGPILVEELRGLAAHVDAVQEVVHADVYEYPDTKIRLHFSDFKILPEGRDTCFRDSPHQCPEYRSGGGGGGGGSAGGANGREEL